MIKVDTTTLSNVVNLCFAFATDARVPQNQQGMFLAEGKRLRGLLMNLLSAQFDDGTQSVLDANQKLTAVNEELSNSAQVLANAAQTLSNVATIVGALDKLLNVAATFI
jgi:hypothetical protein